VNLEMMVLSFLATSSEPRSVSPHWNERLGFLLSEHDDLWWEADENNVSELGRLHASLFADVVDPFLREHSTLRWLASEWRLGRGGWLSDDQRGQHLRQAQALGYSS
jgi:hypothetical protein